VRTLSMHAARLRAPQRTHGGSPVGARRARPWPAAAASLGWGLMRSITHARGTPRQAPNAHPSATARHARALHAGAATSCSTRRAPCTAAARATCPPTAWATSACSTFGSTAKRRPASGSSASCAGSGACACACACARVCVCVCARARDASACLPQGGPGGRLATSPRTSSRTPRPVSNAITARPLRPALACCGVSCCACRGATTGCLHGPCQHFYHYTCARIRAYQGYLRFSLFDRSMACMEHLPMWVAGRPSGGAAVSARQAVHAVHMP
jgi:hypothetical protein